MKTLFGRSKSIVKSATKFTPWFRKFQSLLCRSLVLIIIFISVILLIPPAGLTEPPTYESELSEGQKLVKEFGELTGNPNSSREAIIKKAFEISQSQQAKQILKGPEKGLGKIYNDTVYVGENSIVSKLINKTKAKLKAQGVPQGVLDNLKSIRNKASIDSGSAPMDLDIGIDTKGNKALEKQLLKDLGGVKKVKEFEGTLQTALEDSLKEIAAEAGVTDINIGKVDIQGTTPWSAESYSQPGILEGDSPDAGHSGQTADVTKTKVDKEAELVKKGVKSQESAWQEAARGTLKDRPKMENAFNEIYTQTGKRAGWTNEQEKVWDLLEQLTSEGITQAEIRRINAEIETLTGRDIFGACQQLADAIEAAWKLKPGLKLTSSQFIEVLVTNKDGRTRTVKIEEQLKLRSEGEADWKAYEILRDIIAKARGNQFINSMLATETGKSLLRHATIVAPMALMNMFVKYETGQMNDVHDLAIAMLEVVPFESGFQLMYVGDKSITDKEVLNAFLSEGFFWGLVAACPACAPVLITAAVGEMAWSLANFKVDSVRLQNYQSGLVDLLVYNGEFPDGKFERLILPGNQVIERWDMRRFLFETKSVTIRIAVPDWGMIINNLSEKTEEVYNKFYLANDPAMTQFKDASAQLEKNAGCNANSTEKYCRVYELIQRKLELRRQEVIDAVMIPHLISLAEEKYKTLGASEELKDKLIKLQGELEVLRGSSLGVNLAAKVSDLSKEEANKQSLNENKKLSSGKYWQDAYKAYEKIYSIGNNIKENVSARTGYERAKLLQFKWTGNYVDDLRMAEQSKQGFGSDIPKITRDIANAKGSNPVPSDAVDKQAFDILGDVVFTSRAILDEEDKAKPDEGSKYFEDYKEALDKVKALYSKKGDFQTQLGNGAQIVKTQDFLLLNTPSKFKLNFIDKELQKNFDDGALSIKWTSTPNGTFRPEPDDKGLTTNFTADRPNPVTISVLFEMSVQVEKVGREKVTGSLKVVMPVKVPDNFLLLELIPVALKPEGKGKADTTLDQPGFYGEKGIKLHYKWSGTNCEVEDVDRLWTTVIAPKTGEAKVSVELLIEDADKNRVSLITKTVSFNVDGKPDSKPDGKPDDKTKDDKKDQTTTPTSATQPTTPTVIAQPDSYTKEQIGIDNKTGVKTGVDTQTGTTGQTDTGKTDTGKTDTGKTDTGKTDTGKTDIGKTDTGKTDTTTTSKTDTGKTDTGKTDTGKIDTTTTGKTDTADKPKEPTDEEKKQNFLNCLCKACGGTMGGYYDPKEGNCMCWGPLSGWHEKFSSDPKIVQSCYQSAYGKPLSSNDLKDMSNNIKTGGAPLTDKQKRDLLNCVCKCGSGIVGAGYKPEPVKGASPSCDDLSNGPCMGGDFGCYRWMMPASGACVENCYKSQGLGFNDNLIKAENKKEAKPLKVTLKADKTTLQLGDVVNVNAVVEGGIPAYSYSWSGDHAGQGATVQFTSRSPGSQQLSLTVTDSEKNSASASISLTVEALTVKIELLDKENKIPMGGSRNFKGTVMAGDKPASGDFYFLWQPHPEIQFSPFEKTGGNLSGTKATFNKLGNFKVWVIAHTYKGNVKTTIGESEQIEIEVSKPELKLSYQPQNPKVGQEVKLTVQEKPKMDDKAISFWWEISGNTLNAGPLKNEREYTFRPKDTKPVTVTVHGKAKEGGDDLGEDKATITAQAYEVKLSEPHHLPPKPMIWKCDTQLGKAQDCKMIELEKELAVFNDIFIKASVAPEPGKPPLKYVWSVTPEGRCGIPGAGQELKINCSQPDSYTAAVTVRDSQDIVLGTASTQVGITVTKEDLEKGKKPMVTLQADKTTLKVGETANIKANAQGAKPPFTYQWSAGIEGKGESAKFSPKKSGTQKISVDVTDKAGQKNSATLDIKVEAAKLEVTLKPEKTSIKTGEKVSIKATIKGGEPEFSYKWSEGLEGKGESVQFTPKKSGAQKVSVEVADGKGQKATATLDIKVEAPKLEATLKADKPTIKIGEIANIKAEVKGGEPPLTYKWKEGVEGKEDSARFTPKKSGPQKVSLEITDAAGQKASANLDIKVESLKLEVALKADKSTIKVGETANIKAEVKGGEPAYSFKWGTGVEGKEESAQFSPKKAGTQKITLEVTDSAKQKSTATLEVKIEALKLEVALSVDKSFLKTGETANIKAVVKGGEPAYSYRWGAEVEGKGGSAQFTPKKAGTQKITVEVTDSLKQKSSATVEIKVEPPKLEVALKADKSPVKTGETAKIKAEVKGGTPPFSYSWSSQVQGGGETADFFPKTQGFYKIYVEVRDADQKKAVGNLDVTVQEGKGDSKTSDTKEAASKQRIEPEILKVASGETGVFKAFEIDKTGKKTEIAPSKVSWKIDLYRGATIDKTGKVSVDKSAKPGTSIKVTALFEKSQAGATIEITEASKTTSTTKESGIKEVTKTTKIIQPDPLQLSPGGSGSISLLEKDDQGRTYPPTDSRKLSWKLGSTIKDITLKPQKDGVVVITVAKSAKAGTKVKILAGLEKSQIAGTIEIIPSSQEQKSEIRTYESKPTKVVKDTTSSKSKGSSQEGYNPLTDPSFKDEKPTLDTDKMDKFKGDFQEGQWASQTKKTKSASEGSQNVQQQPTDYTNTTKKTDQTDSTSQTQPSTDTTKTTTDTNKTTTDTTKPTTDTTKTTDKTKTSTQTATSKGIDVQVVGTASAGKCIIVDGQLVPVKGYKENIANMTVTLTGPVNKTVTSSSTGTFKFPEIPSGSYVISVKQWNYGMTKQNFTAPSGKSVKIVLKGSCPFLYVWTGNAYERENDIYSVARLMPQELLSNEARMVTQKEGLYLHRVSLENIPEKLKKEKSQVDYYRLTRSLKADTDGNYRLKISEQATEHSFTDWVQLIALDHRKGTKIGISRDGQPFIYQDLQPLSSSQKPASLYNGESIEINLPSEAFQKGIIAMTWQGFLDGKADDHSAVAGQPKLSLQRQNPQGIWQTVDWVYPRDESQETFFLLKDLGPGWDADRKIKLIASSCDAEKYHRIDSLAWARLISDLPRVTYLDLLSAIKSTGEEVLKALKDRDGRYLFLGPEEAASLVFKGVPIKENMERSFVFVSKGFYIPLPWIRLTSN